MSVNNVTELQQFELDEMDELLDNLGTELNNDEGVAPEEQVFEVAGQRFAVNDLDGLNWTFRKLDAYAAKLDAAKALRDAELARVNGWFEGQAKSLTAKKELFERLVRDYGERGRANDPNWKGEKTPYGTLSFTKSQPDWIYTDEAAVVSFLKTDEALAAHVKAVEVVADKAKVKTALEVKRNVFVKDGEVVDVAKETPGGWAGMQYVESWREVEPKDWEGKEVPEGATLTGDAESGGYLIGIIDTETGEYVADVQLVAAVAVANGAKVVPGLTITDKPDRINVKREAK